jgi:type III secretory pathway component EscS
MKHFIDLLSIFAYTVGMIIYIFLTYNYILHETLPTTMDILSVVAMILSSIYIEVRQKEN